jgi:hypothetical protein
MNEDTALAERPPEPEALTMTDPRDSLARATIIATELKRIIDTQKLSVGISGKEHVLVEGWTTLAALNGCTPLEISNEDAGGGVFVAVVELVNSNGRTIGRASSECGSEPMWAKRDPNARRSMANTRATSKVCRQVFSWVMALAGYATTPAEEMDFAKEAPAEKAPQSEWDGNLRFKSGKNKGKAWKDMNDNFVQWAATEADGAMKDMGAKELARRAKLESNVVEGEVVEREPGSDDLPFAQPDPQDPRFQ